MTIKLQSAGVVYRELNDPYFVMSGLGTVMHYGEYDEMQEVYNQSKEAYERFGYLDMSKDLHLVKMPHDQEEADRLFNITGYSKKYLPIKEGVFH